MFCGGCGGQGKAEYHIFQDKTNILFIEIGFHFYKHLAVCLEHYLDSCIPNRNAQRSAIQFEKTKNIFVFDYQNQLENVLYFSFCFKSNAY